MLAVTWNSLFTGKQADLQSAITLFQEGKKLTPKSLVLDTHYAHALALLGKEEQALDVYKSHLGEILYMSNGEKRGTWEEIILIDFQQLEKEGIDSPTFNKVKKIMSADDTKKDSAD